MSVCAGFDIDRNGVFLFFSTLNLIVVLGGCVPADELRYIHAKSAECNTAARGVIGHHAMPHATADACESSAGWRETAGASTESSASQTSLAPG